MSDETRTRLRMSEMGVVAGVLVVVHAFLWSRSVPLPYQDLSFYFEPAILLARHGWLAGPASHYQDLTFVRGMYFYPPGFPLVLAGWIVVFGASAAALLAYTHVVHALYLAALWVILRTRVGCTRVASALALFSAFPMFNHGRADGTALLLGALAWLALPARPRPARIALAAVLLGLAVLVSPPFGISSAVVVGVWLAMRVEGNVRQKALAFSALAGMAVLTFAGIWAAMLTWQDAWSYGPQQFAVTSRVRASELNHFPAPSPYLYAFAVLPLGLLTLLPLLGTLLPPWRPALRTVRDTAIAYLAGFCAWFVLSKAPLLTGGHFSFLGRAPFHAALASSRGRVGSVGLGLLFAVAAIHWYHQKDTLLALAQGARQGDDPATFAFRTNQIVALDSDAFLDHYRDGRTVTYELMPFDYWRRTRELTPPATLRELGLERCTAPVIPDAVLLSSRSLVIFGPPDSALYAPALAAPKLEMARLFGRPVRFPAEPRRLHLYVRRGGSAREDARATGCRLLPAREP